jgi:hypothetical protein
MISATLDKQVSSQNSVNIDVNGAEKRTNKRATALADRLEEGAALLASYAEGLTADQWNTPISANDKRTVGQVVNHVALMYPIETGAVQAIASGTAVTDVTWEVVADINAGQAAEHANVTKALAIELLRKNSLEAADAIRQLTDKELDTAAPFSLAYGAPVTAQFGIEDHPLRHPWHHLFRIKKALEK